MNVDNIRINTQSSIRIEFDKVIYFDPYMIEEINHDADIIFITHEHYDHFDPASIDKVKNENTVVVAPKSMKNEVGKIVFKDYLYLEPNEEIDLEGINIKTIPAYNKLKPFHPKLKKWLGYIINYNNITYYIAGDTDKTKENESVKCDIAFVPIGGYYTMDVNDATELLKIINPKVAIPIHYGSIVGDKEFGQELKDNLTDTTIEVIEKLY